MYKTLHDFTFFLEENFNLTKLYKNIPQHYTQPYNKLNNKCRTLYNSTTILQLCYRKLYNTLQKTLQHFTNPYNSVHFFTTKTRLTFMKLDRTLQHCTHFSKPFWTNFTKLNWIFYTIVNISTLYTTLHNYTKTLKYTELYTNLHNSEQLYKQTKLIQNFTNLHNSTQVYTTKLFKNLTKPYNTLQTQKLHTVYKT